ASGKDFATASQRVSAMLTSVPSGDQADRADSSGGGPRRVGRGVFLATVLGGVSSLAWGKSAWSRLSHLAGPVESLAPLLPSGGWRIYTVSGSMPSFDPARWRLTVSGLVEHPLSLSYPELRALPRADQVSAFHCVTGRDLVGP